MGIKNFNKYYKSNHLIQLKKIILKNTKIKI